jgi:SAM-dependent methyltransferase
MVKDLPFDVEYIGEWGHPRAQKMLAFKKRSLAVADTDEGVRGLSLSEAASLPAGSNHYRAYVGPPNRFDFMSATQFSLLFTLGLRDHHRVLDFGCGSLRLGRLLVPFLQRDKYYGIEPNAWLIEDAIKFELGRDIVGIKNPKFSENDDFNCSVFGKKFDFIVAQSVVTHCGPDLFQKLIVNFSEVLSDDGIVAFSYWNTEDKLPTPPKDGWHYPSSVKYLEDEVRGFVETAGLVGLPVPWYHPGASWYLAARTRERLPRPEELRFLRGAVLHDEQFVASRNT